MIFLVRMPLTILCISISNVKIITMSITIEYTHASYQHDRWVEHVAATVYTAADAYIVLYLH